MPLIFTDEFENYDRQPPALEAGAARMPGYQSPARCETGEVAAETGECLRCNAAQGEACKGKRT